MPVLEELLLVECDSVNENDLSEWLLLSVIE